MADPAGMTGDRSRIRELSQAECLELLGSGVVGRIAVTSHALPAVVPVNYRVQGSSIVFRTDPDGMLARACDDAVVAFEVDDLAPDGRSGWSVLVVGVATLLSGSQALRAGELNLVSAPGPGRDQFISVSFGRVTGRVLAADAAPLSRAPRPRAHG